MQEKFFDATADESYLYIYFKSRPGQPSNHLIIMEPFGTMISWKELMAIKIFTRLHEDLLKWDQALYTDQIVSKALLDSAFTLIVSKDLPFIIMD